MQYFYYLKEKYEKEAKAKKIEQLHGIYSCLNNNEPVLINYVTKNYSEDVSLLDMSDKLLSKDYFNVVDLQSLGNSFERFPLSQIYVPNDKPITIIVDSPSDLLIYDDKNSTDNFVKYMTELYENNVYISFYRFPYLSTTSIVKQLDGLGLDKSLFNKALEIQYGIYKDYVSYSAKGKSASLTFAKNSGMDIGRLAGRKSNDLKNQKVIDYIKSNHERFVPNGKSDKEIFEFISNSDFKVSRNTYYRLRSEIKEDEKY